MADNKQLTINILSQVIVFIIQIGINFLLTPFIVNSLGVGAYGFVGLSANIIGYMQIATVALNSMAGRFITIEYHKGNVKSANSYFSSVFHANLVLGVFLALLSVFTLLYLEFFIDIPGELLYDVKILFAFLCVNSILTLIFNVYTVSAFIKNRLDIIASQNLISNIIRFGLLICLFGFFKSKLWFIGLSTILSSAYIVIVNLRIKKRLTPELGVKRKYYDYSYIKELLASGVWNLVSKLGDIMQRGFDLLFANWFVNSAAMGILAITSNIPFLILQVFSMLSSSFAPIMTRDFANGDIDSIKRELNKTVRLFSLITLIPLSVLYIYGDVFYKLWMPDQDYKLLQQLTVCGTFALVMTLPTEGFWNVFTVTNKIKGSSIYMIVNSIAVFITVLSLLFYFEDNTAKMFVIAGTRSVYGVLRGLFFTPVYGAYCLNLKWNYFYSDLIKPLFGLILSISVLSLVRFIYIPDTWMTFLLMASVVSIVSSFVGAALILKKSDINLIYTLIEKQYDKIRR